MAAGDGKIEYGAADQAITITLLSLAQAACRGSAAIDNTTNKFKDAIVYLGIPILTGTPASDKVINVYAYGSEDGTNYDDNALGTDAAITLRVPTNLKLLGQIATPDGGALTYKKTFRVAWAFDGVLPPKWGIAVENRTNLAFNATEANIIKLYRGVYDTVAP